jgi:Cysteine dioxygenase type I
VQHRREERKARESSARRRSPKRLTTDRLAAMARSVALAEKIWRPLVQHDPAARWFLRLHRTPIIEIWLLTWTQEQGIELHDHGGASGAVLVVDGELTEHFTSLAASAQVWQPQLPRGYVRCFGAAHVHDLQNRGEGAATSIHVYSPALTSMTFYQRDRAGLLVPSRVERVDGGVRMAPAVAAHGGDDAQDDR